MERKHHRTTFSLWHVHPKKLAPITNVFFKPTRSSRCRQRAARTSTHLMPWNDAATTQLYTSARQHSSGQAAMARPVAL